MSEKQIIDMDRKLDLLLQRTDHLVTKEDCLKAKAKLDAQIQSCKIWSLARDIFLLFSINVIAVIAGIKIAFPSMKLF